MDLCSPDRSVEEYKGDEVASVAETPDLIMLHNKIQPVDEAINGMVKTELTMENSVSIMLPVGVNDDKGMPFSITKPSSPDPSAPLDRGEERCLKIESDLDRDDADRIPSCYTEGLKSPMDEYHTRKEKEGTEYVGISSKLLDTDTNAKFNEKVETEALELSTDDPLQKIDDRHANEVADDKNIDHQTAYSPTANELVNGDSGNTEEHSSGKDELFRMEMSGRVDSEYTDMKEDNCPTAMLPSDNGGAEEEYSGQQSPRRTRNAARSPEQPLSVSPERSLRTKHSARHEEHLSPANKDMKKTISPSSSKRKRSSSPEKHNVSRKRASSRDRSSPSLRRSPSDRTAQRNSHHRGDSPRQRLSASPRRRDSSQKRDRPASRSPVRRRDSSGHRRDYRARSRSRSPYSRDRHRRSPRRSSPRRRSPPSGRHSRQRPWSPPANRNTGIGRPGNNLFVAGFSYGTTERDLEKKFSRYGRVKDVRVVREKRTGDSRGFGFLSMETDEDADAAIRALDQTEWNGRIVLVEKSKTALR